jgi:hypothetical protein
VKVFLRSIGLGCALTVINVLLSATSDPFNRLGIVYVLRKNVFDALVSVGMNPHQPSDRLAIPAFLFLFTMISLVLFVGIALLKRATNRNR